MIHMKRTFTGGRPGPEAAVWITCDVCGATAPEAGGCDPDDADAALVLADFLRMRCGWKRAGRMILCPTCRRRPRC